MIEFPPEQIQQKGRLQPGRMFLVDTEEGRIVVDNEIKGKISRQKPYRRWLEENRIELRGLVPAVEADAQRSQDAGPAAPLLRLHARGPADGRRRRWRPTARSRSARWAPTRRWPCSPNRPKLLFNYFKQLFAQVTNPPIDPLARRAGDVADVVHRQAAEPAGRDARALPATEAPAPDPDQRRHGAAADGRPRRFQGGHAAGPVSGRHVPIRPGA